MTGIGQSARFVPRMSSGYDLNSVQTQLTNGRLDQSHMGRVWRVKRAAKNPQTEDVCFFSGCVERNTQTQSLGTKKWLSKSASGEPGSS
jgi:hypothetical protein